MGFTIATTAVMFNHRHPEYSFCLLMFLSGIYATTLMTVLNSRVKFAVIPHTSSWNQCVVDGYGMQHVVQRSSLGAGTSSTGSTTHGAVMVRVAIKEVDARSDANYALTKVSSLCFLLNRILTSGPTFKEESLNDRGIFNPNVWQTEITPVFILWYQVHQ